MAQLHSTRTAVHRPYAGVYADAAARLAATGFVRSASGEVPFDSTDLYKKALQLNDASEWILTAVTPTWVQVSGAGALAADSVTNTLLSNMAQSTIKGRAAGAGTGDPTDLSATQATAILNAVVGDSGAGGTKGLVPVPAAGDTAAGKFLKASGAWEAPGGATIAPLVIEDANTVAQRNGATSQNFSVYRSYTDASNYTRLRIGPSGSGANHEIAAEKAGTGSDLPIRISSSNAAVGSIEYDGARLYPSNNLTQDLGKSGAIWREILGDLFQANSIIQWVDGVKLTSDGTGSGNDNVLRIAGRFKNGGTFTGGSESPGAITSNQNNYTRDAAYLQRWSSDASRDITGLSMGGNVADSVAVIVNVGANNIVLKHQDAGSTDTNRFLCSTGADITLSVNQAADIIYDGTTQRWRLFKRN